MSHLNLLGEFDEYFIAIAIKDDFFLYFNFIYGSTIFLKNSNHT